MEIFENLYAFLWMDPTANNCNTYILKGEKNILIDPGHFHLFSHVLDGLKSISMSLDDIDLIFITHGHPDHMEAVRRFTNPDTLVAFSSIELDFIKKVAPHYGEALGISEFEPQILLKEGSLTVGDNDFQVLHTPGHSPGSMCLYWPEKKVLFTGDVIFNGGIGRTDLPGGSGEALKKSIKRLAELDVDYVLSGHGDIVYGRDHVTANFREIESFWFGYI